MSHHFFQPRKYRCGRPGRDHTLDRKGDAAHRLATQHRRGPGGTGGAPSAPRRRSLWPVRDGAQRGAIRRGTGDTAAGVLCGVDAVCGADCRQLGALRLNANDAGAQVRRPWHGEGVRRSLDIENRAQKFSLLDMLPAGILSNKRLRRRPGGNELQRYVRAQGIELVSNGRDYFRPIRDIDQNLISVCFGPRAVVGL